MNDQTWEVLVAKTGEINKVGSRGDALLAIANVEGCDIRDLGSVPVPYRVRCTMCQEVSQ